MAEEHAVLASLLRPTSEPVLFVDLGRTLLPGSNRVHRGRMPRNATGHMHTDLER